MFLTLIGHNRRFALEQSIFNFFPEETIEFQSGDVLDGNHCTSTLKDGVATTRLNLFLNFDSWLSRPATATIEEAGSLDNALRLSFYRAALPFLPTPPPWGSLTGIRPAKKALEFMDAMPPKPPNDASSDIETMIENMKTVHHVQPAQARIAAEAALATHTLRQSIRPRDIALYLGMPFCPSRCAYCSFVSAAAGKEGHLIPAYIDHFCAEIAQAAALCHKLNLRVRWIYHGGGTPTTPEAPLMQRVFDALRAFPCPEEHTVEAGRPETITADRLRVLQSADVHRISVNPQTLIANVLNAIGRHHTPEQFFQAYDRATSFGFAVNCDLIAGLPDETAASFRTSLDQILALSPQNITVHNLARKRGNALPAALPAPPVVAEMLDTAETTLRGAGYAPYYLYRQKFTGAGRENVGWSKPNHLCRYNIVMMEELCTVLALGAGGVTKLIDPQTGQVERLFQYKYAKEYLDDPAKSAKNLQAVADFYRA